MTECAGDGGLESWRYRDRAVEQASTNGVSQLRAALSRRIL